MSTGSIILNFEAPDVTLTGMGEFDVSETFKALFANNSAIKEQISNKITEIFKNIKAKDVATNWTDKIKNSLNLKPSTIDLKSEINKTLKEGLKGLNLNIDSLKVNPISAVQSKVTERFLKVFESVPFTNFLKAFGTVHTTNFLKAFSTQSADLLKNITSSASGLDNADTTFESIPEITVANFSDKAMDQLSSLFGKSYKIKNNMGNILDEFKKPEKGFLSKIMDWLLPALGLTALPAILGGLAGSALLAGGLVWMAIDGIRGWLKAEDWGVSSIAAVLGGAFGGLSSGIEGAISNAIKGGLVGGGIGAIMGGPVGFIAGTLIGAALGGILGWIGGEDLAKKIDEVSKHIGTWFNKNIDTYINESLGKQLLHATGTVSLGPQAEDSTRELRHGFLNAFIVQPLNNWIKKFSMNTVADLAKTFTLEKVGSNILSHVGMKATSEKVGSNILSHVGMKATSKLVMRKIFSRLPIVSAILGIREAYDYFVQGNILSGLLALESGFAGTIPGLGTGISILLDVVNIGLTGTETGKKYTSKFNISFAKFTEFLKHVPFIGSLIYMSEAVGHFAAGDWKEGLKSLGYAGLTNVFGWLYLTPEEGIKSVSHGLTDFWKLIKSQWDEAFLSFQVAWNTLSDWFSNLGSNVVDYVKNKFNIFEKIDRGVEYNKGELFRKVRHETEDELKKSATQTKAMVVSKKQPSITFQAAKDDKLYTMGSTDVYAKKDDILGKTFTNIDKQLTNMVNAINSLIKVNNEHSKVFANLLSVNQDQLKMLPALASHPQQTAEHYPNSDVRDPAYEYRKTIYDNLRRG